LIADSNRVLLGIEADVAPGLIEVLADRDGETADATAQIEDPMVGLEPLVDRVLDEPGAGALESLLALERSLPGVRPQVALGRDELIDRIGLGVSLSQAGHAAPDYRRRV
jgi:hypothetical protein